VKTQYVPLTVVFLGLAFNPTLRAWSASFDCSASGLANVDRMICQDPQLSELDSKLGAAYASAKTSLPPGERSSLLATQRAWIAQRNKCSDASCLLDSYKTRIRELTANTEASTPPEATLVAGAITPHASAQPSSAGSAPMQPSNPDSTPHKWVRVDERDVSGGVGITGHAVTEVDTMSVVRESNDKRLALVRATTTVPAAHLNQVLAAHYAISCSQQVFVVRDASVTMIDEKGVPQTVTMPGNGNVIKAKFDSVDSKVLDYLCAS
jgi:uncharacterized protein